MDGVLIHYKELTITPAGLQPPPPSTSTPDAVDSGASNAPSAGNAGRTDGAGAARGPSEEPLTILFVHGFNGSVYNFRHSMPDIAAVLGANRCLPRLLCPVCVLAWCTECQHVCAATVRLSRVLLLLPDPQLAGRAA